MNTCSCAGPEQPICPVGNGCDIPFAAQVDFKSYIPKFYGWQKSEVTTYSMQKKMRLRDECLMTVAECKI